MSLGDFCSLACAVITAAWSLGYILGYVQFVFKK
jgi:hypothetical protein